MEETMAKLEGVQEFYKHFHQCLTTLRNITKQITPVSHPDHVQQAEQQSELVNAVISLTNAVAAIVHYNR
jgi:hypothetical protein